MPNDFDGPDFFAPLTSFEVEPEDQAYTDAEAAQEAMNEAWYEARSAMWDDDPNPYAGTYSEE